QIDQDYIIKFVTVSRSFNAIVKLIYLLIRGSPAVDPMIR
ncbi:unnamed protein product, partial [Brassica rapa]